MTEITFSTYTFRTENRSDKKFIFDEVRRKWVILSPEEWVRQHILHYLMHDKSVPRSLIAVEKGIKLNGLQKRFDVVVFGHDGTPKLIVECKAPEEHLDEPVFHQIAAYNLSLQVNYLWVTNGKFNFFCKLKNGIELLKNIPDVEILLL